ncbi:MAG TPA: thioredoxin-like domain-containing protein [Gemmatales bacterium]|nr:thioredoxin-like domain-containing protein [Gemmatales bacterium]
MGMMRWVRNIVLSSAVISIVGLAATQAAPPEAVAQILRWQPSQKGVVVAMPTDAEAATCTVAGDPNAKPGQSVWVLKDAKGTILRRFVDTNGDKFPDVFSYYKDGMEVYREVDTKFAGKPDRFQWLNTGGSKIGVSKAGNGVIDSWVAISLEEMTQEAMKAVATKDFNRYAALLVNDDDLRTIGVAATEVERIKTGLKNVSGQFAQAAAKLNLNDTTKWLHVETGTPSRLSADTTGWKQDVVIHARAMVLCETNTKTEYIQLGDMIQVGDTWKLKDAPTTLETTPGQSLMAGNTPQTPAAVEDGPLQKALKELADLDAKAPQDAGNGPNPTMVTYHKARAELISRIVAVSPEKDRETWFKQLIDSLSATVAASAANDNSNFVTFQTYSNQVAKQYPGSEIASYAQYRVLNIENNNLMAAIKKAEDHLKAQEAFAGKLSAFVSAYPQGSDTPEAMHRIGEIYEMLNKEAEARKWYETVVTKYADSKFAQKSTGAVRRLTSLGQTWTIGVNAQVLNGPAFNPATLQGRTVVVYYWATWCNTAAADFAKMKQIMAPFTAKGVVLVAVNIDDKLADVQAFFQKNTDTLPPALHLHSPGSFESPAAIHYGLGIFPGMFLQDASGKITSRTLDVATLDEELKKIVK